MLKKHMVITLWTQGIWIRTRWFSRWRRRRKRLAMMRLLGGLSACGYALTSLCCMYAYCCIDVEFIGTCSIHLIIFLIQHSLFLTLRFVFCNFSQVRLLGKNAPQYSSYIRTSRPASVHRRIAAGITYNALRLKHKKVKEITLSKLKAIAQHYDVSERTVLSYSTHVISWMSLFAVYLQEFQKNDANNTAHGKRGQHDSDSLLATVDNVILAAQRLSA